MKGYFLNSDNNQLKSGQVYSIYYVNCKFDTNRLRLLKINKKI